MPANEFQEEDDARQPGIGARPVPGDPLEHLLLIEWSPDLELPEITAEERSLLDAFHSPLIEKIIARNRRRKLLDVVPTQHQ